MALKMSDKLQFVAGLRHSSSAESPDKLKFVGHFWIRQRYQDSPHSKGCRPIPKHLLDGALNAIGF